MTSELERFKDMVESSQDWFWEFDENADFTYVSPRIKDLLGYEPEEIIGLNAFDLMAPAEAERVRKHFDPIAKRYLPFNCLENTNLHKDGHEVIIESSGTPVFDDQGAFKGYRGIDRDVTAQRRAEQNFRHVFTEMMDAFALHEVIYSNDGTPLDYRFLIVNPAFEEITGLKAADVIGKTVSEVQPEIERRWIDMYNEVALKGKPVHFEVYSQRLQRHFEVKAYSPYKKQFACLFVDVTRQKKMEQELKDSEERFRSAFITNPHPVVLAKLSDGNIIDVNTAFEVQTGIQRITAIGHNTEDLGLWVHTDKRQSFREEILQHGEVLNYEVDFKVKGGQVRACKLSAKIFDINSEPHILVVVRDITHEKIAERTLIEMDKLKNEFISTAAHELRTPLTAIMGFAELLNDPVQQWGFSDEQKTDFIQEIFDRGLALKGIVDDLLDISRIESGRDIDLKLEKTSLQSVIKKSVDLFKSQYRAHDFKTKLPPEVMSVQVNIDRHRMTQVIENLLSNAVKYSPEGSLVSIEGKINQDVIEISISDNGIGMTEEETNRVFDKFYRADSSATGIGGFGLGMSIAKQIVEAHNGEISVESEKDKGTTFTFTLPMWE